MKKILFFFLASLIFAGCSSDNEDLVDDSNDLVPATIGIGVDEPAISRSFLGSIDKNTDTNEEKISHHFEMNDKVMLIDGLGKHVFTVGSQGTTTTMSGSWGKPEKYPNLCALFPEGSVRGVNPLVVNNNQPTMSFTLPTSQTSRDLNSNSGISYDRSAGLAFACQNDKDNRVAFIPVVSYLYFYSREVNCKIVSTQNIAGDYNVTYKADKGTNNISPSYSTAKGIWANQRMGITASANTITCTGKKISAHADKFQELGLTGDFYEYIIAIKPGTYAINGLKIINSLNEDSPFHNKVQVEFIPSSTYYLGSID